MEHDNTRWIDERFADLGLTPTFGEHVDEDDEFRSASIASRVEDLHAAFSDDRVAGIITVIGGFNSNELLPHLDWDLIASHPKIICGYSDITALLNAIQARTGLITYSGPHWSTFGMRDHFEPTGQWFRAALMESGPKAIEPSQVWTDDPWFADQDHRDPKPNPGWTPLRDGTASGRIVGGNLCWSEGRGWPGSTSGTPTRWSRSPLVAGRRSGSVAPALPSPCRTPEWCRRVPPMGFEPILQRV